MVFTADHGLAVGQHGLFGKQNMYDHSVRVPFVVTGPGVAAGASNDAPVYLQDIIPTSLDGLGQRLLTMFNLKVSSLTSEETGKSVTMSMEPIWGCRDPSP